MNAVSLHLACKTYDPPTPDTVSCVDDAESMRQFARNHGFTALGVADMTLVDAATDQALETFLTAAEALTAGDYVAITYCGHGAAVRARANNTERGWAMFHGNLVTFSDLLNSLARHLATGVRVLIISDSCQSGLDDTDPAAGTPLEVSHAVAEKLFLRLATRFLRFDMLFNDRAAGNPTIVKINACGGSQFARDGSLGQHSRFATKLLNVLNGRPNSQSFNNFIAAMQNGAPSDEKPTVERYGPADAAFEAAGPFNPV